ncbi:uncharacterized protein LOC142985582 [Anticarsia gemmatalis]|uniref:uncharacterized protein LOC142985582 n=1 Tax=Anticarsia gemmatalis TaxID=129554 RepID=UPI003F75B1C4
MSNLVKKLTKATNTGEMDKRFRKNDQDQKKIDIVKDRIDSKIFSIDNHRQFRRYIENEYDNLRPSDFERDAQKNDHMKPERVKEQGNLKTLINIVKRPKNFGNLENKLVEKAKSNDRPLSVDKMRKLRDNFEYKSVIMDPDKKVKRNVSLDTKVFDKIDKDNLKLEEKRIKNAKKHDDRVKELNEMLETEKIIAKIDTTEAHINDDAKTIILETANSPKCTKKFKTTEKHKDEDSKFTDERKLKPNHSSLKTKDLDIKRKDSPKPRIDLDKKAKKTDAVSKVKDRGDLKLAKVDKVIKKGNDIVKILNPDGDTVANKAEKVKLDIVMTLPVKERTKNEKEVKPNDVNKKVVEMPPKLQGVVKNKARWSPVRFRTQVRKDETCKIGEKNQEKLAENKHHSSEGTQTNSTYSDFRNKKTEKDPPVRKRPIIKTIMTKNGSMKVYKAVTFEEKKPQPTPLEINIPTDVVKKNKPPKFDSSLKCKITVSKASVKVKPDVKVKVSKDKRNRRMSSPDYSRHSPPTEVAMWAPSCITKHTKPYYEAWVDTTLTAVSKAPKEKVLYENDYLDTFTSCVERPFTPELVYSQYADERYTGKIKITQR